MFTDDQANEQAEKLFPDTEFKAPEDCKSLVTLTQASRYLTTRKKQNKFLMWLSIGLTIKDAAEASGFSERTIYDWKNEQNCSFRSRVTQAMDYSRRFAIAQIHKHANKDWKAAAWLLERKYPKEWAEVKKAQVDINVTGTLNVQQKKNIADRFLGLLGDDESFNLQNPSTIEA